MPLYMAHIPTIHGPPDHVKLSTLRKSLERVGTAKSLQGTQGEAAAEREGYISQGEDVQNGTVQDNHPSLLLKIGKQNLLVALPGICQQL